MTVRRFFGGMFVSVGLIIVVLSGACTLYVGLMELFQRPAGPADRVPLQLILVVGGIPFLVGLVLLFVGGRLRRSKSADADD